MGIDAQAVKDKRQLVHQGNVDIPLRVFNDFGRFRHFDRACPVRSGLHDTCVKIVDKLGCCSIRSRSHLGDRRQAMLLVAGIDPLRAVSY